MSDRRWSDADRELVAALVRALPPPPSPPGAVGGLGPSPEEFGDRVLDALTAAGWMRGHCPGCDCPDVPHDAQPPTGRLVIDGSDDAR